MTLERWKRHTEWPLAAVALVFLAVYAWTVIGNLRSPEDTLPEVIMAVIWGIFVLDYAVSLFLARPRGHWFLTHLHDLAIVVLPALRPLRLLRLVTLLSILHRTAGNALRGRVTVFVIAASVLLVFVAGLAVLDAEQNAAGSNIRSFGDAVWWAFVTITTVGYGDFFPVTFLGRLIAVGLMIAGIALIGTVTAALASWFVEAINRDRHAVDSESTAAASRGGAPVRLPSTDPE